MDEEAVVAALEENAVPLSGTDPGSGSDPPRSDLAPVVDRVGDAEVVGLGEVTHGTRECVDLKHRVIRRLVERGEVGTVAVEADAAAMVAVDAHVRGASEEADGDGAHRHGADHGAGTPWHGEADLRAAVAGLEKWLWRIEGVLALCSWLRSFNEDRPPADRVRVRGVDLGDPAALAGPLRSSLAAVDPDLAADLAGELDTLSEGSVPSDDAARERRLDAVESAAGTVLDRIAADGGDASPTRDRETARYLARVIERSCTWHRVRHERPGPHAAGMAERDRGMAANVARCAGRGPGGSVAVWAHNSHVQRGTFDDGTAWTDARTMGDRLASEFGGGYRPVGFDVGRGSFRALDGRAGDPGPRTFSVGDPPAETATARFDALDAPAFLDLSAAADDPDLAPWFDADRRIRWVGSVYRPGADPGTHFQETDLPASYDGLFYLARSSPTRPLEG